MLDIKAGDVFGSKNPMALGRAINFSQKIWSRDNKSSKSHSGIILKDDGTTFEALWTVTSQNFYEAYAGEGVIVARPTYKEDGKTILTPDDIDWALREIVKGHRGQWYPLWRIPMHMIPPLAKITLFDKLVCSEITAKYEWLLGARHGQYAGTNPDTLSDEWHHWDNFEVIFDGKLEG